MHFLCTMTIKIGLMASFSLVHVPCGSCRSFVRDNAPTLVQIQQQLGQQVSVGCRR